MRNNCSFKRERAKGVFYADFSLRERERERERERGDQIVMWTRLFLSALPSF